VGSGVDDAVRVEDRDEVRGVADQGAEARLTDAYRLLSSLALRDVLELADGMQRSALRVADEGGAQPDPNNVFVLAQVALLHLERADLAGEESVDLRQVRLKIVGVRDLLERPGQQLRF
jgi:hypothetical protein